MLPAFIKNEIARRVGDATTEVAQLMGIDPSTPPGEPDDRVTLPPREFPPINEGPIIRGTLIGLASQP